MRPPCGIPRQIHLREKVVAACQAQTALRQQRIPPHEVGGRFKAGVAIAPEGRAATENAVLCGSTIVALTQTELRLLSYMMKQPEKAYSREELLSAVWGFDSEVETRVTDETLRRIRKKLLQAGSTVSVSTIWGFGYKLKGAERT